MIGYTTNAAGAGDGNNNGVEFRRVPIFTDERRQPACVQGFDEYPTVFHYRSAEEIREDDETYDQLMREHNPFYGVNLGPDVVRVSM